MSVCLFSESRFLRHNLSVQNSGWQASCHIWAPEEFVSHTLACEGCCPALLQRKSGLGHAAFLRVAVILNPPAGPLRRFDFEGLVRCWHKYCDALKAGMT